MNMQALQYIQKLRNLNRSDLARLAGVSRQAVSAWFQKDEYNVGSATLLTLSKSLNVSTDLLLNPLPLVGEQDRKKELEVVLNWDALFPSIDDFLVALTRQDLRALARLVQVYGLYASEKIVGKSTWTKFHRYKRHIRPQRREQCEKLWTLEQSHLSH